MEWLDYRKKLGIGFSDSEKYKLFCRKMYNHLEGIAREKSVGIHVQEYYKYCNMCGIEVNYDICSDPDKGVDRFRDCLSVIRSKDYCIESFLAYYVAFINSMDAKYHKNNEKEKLVRLLTNKLNESQIAFEIIKDEGDILVFPQENPELDCRLVSEPLLWLEEYPLSHKAFVKALREYANLNDDNASDVADKFRKALETFFQEFFGKDRSLENLQGVYGEYLKEKGIPKEIRQSFNTVLQMYTNYMNAYAKHHDKANTNALEYIMYETGNIIRLIIMLK